MNKWRILFLAATLISLLTACGAQEEPKPTLESLVGQTVKPLEDPHNTEVYIVSVVSSGGNHIAYGDITVILPPGSTRAIIARSASKTGGNNLCVFTIQFDFPDGSGGETWSYNNCLKLDIQEKNNLVYIQEIKFRYTK